MTNDQLQFIRSLIYPFTHLRIHSLVNQIDQSMQNKPNFQKDQMNVNYCFTMKYEQITMNNEQKNKPKQTQFRTS